MKIGFILGLWKSLLELTILFQVKVNEYFCNKGFKDNKFLTLYFYFFNHNTEILLIEVRYLFTVLSFLINRLE